MLRIFFMYCCIITVAYCSLCTPSDVEKFYGCMNDTSPQPEDFDKCFTQNHCKVPDMSRTGSSKRAGKGKRHGSLFTDEALSSQCVDQLRKDVTDGIKQCVQAIDSNFDFPASSWHSSHIMGPFKGKGKGSGKGKGDNFVDNSCAAATEVKSCLDKMLNQTDMCAKMDSCKAKSKCNKTETDEAVCNCATTTIQEKGKDYEDSFFKCLTKENPNSKKFQSILKAKAMEEFCPDDGLTSTCKAEKGIAPKAKGKMRAKNASKVASKPEKNASKVASKPEDASTAEVGSKAVKAGKVGSKMGKTKTTGKNKAKPKESTKQGQGEDGGAFDEKR